MKPPGRLTPERPLTHDLFATVLDDARRAHRADRHLRPRRRDVPRPAGAEPARTTATRSMPGRRTRSRSRCGSACPIFAPADVLDRAATVPDEDDDDDEEGGEEAGATATRRREPADPEATDEASTRPASHLPRVRELARPRGRPARRRAPRARRRPASPATRPGSAGPGAARARRFAHSRRRRLQKSFTARQMTDGLAPVGEPAVRGVVRDADLGDRPAGCLDLDQQLRREEGAARLDPDALQGLAAEQLAGAVHVA